MRFSPPVMAIAAIFALSSSATFSQEEEYQPDPRSVVLVDDAKAALNIGETEKAIDLFEAALAIDPANRAAYLGLAETARANGLPGKAIGLYRRILELEPNNIAALSGQGRAFVQRGAMEKAKINLTRLKDLCEGDCIETTLLSAAVEEGAPEEVLSAEAVTPAPTVSDEGETQEP
ncbi:tetratricopeptide repeat protein [Alterisphingorhabdus coralli]|uniref:Tetratricopeptide repeat protein n=1 Tax=Alterisphingorhabdus coralli TaxID=3071408 RepID=A0AA97F5P8_9SPHN|nr:tetratricopeptide repeat protein [Parasphingorhabdus sp. SCSIO 66989]WOE73808.1 tetratricopeptide repeat protein [Parasphingorhabdus sp. SCSIO 66989]